MADKKGGGFCSRRDDEINLCLERDRLSKVVVLLFSSSNFPVLLLEMI